MNTEQNPIRWLVLAVCLMALKLPVTAQPTKSQTKVLITNARIFDGERDQLSERMSLLVEGNKIRKIAKTIPAPEGASMIDAGGRTLMPGLINAHTHLIFSDISQQAALTADNTYITLIAGKAASETLLRGFTAVRDVGGPTFGLKRAIDEGVLPGPRIWPSGATISQTSGHGDFRSAAHDLTGASSRNLHWTEQAGFTTIADGRAEVLRAVREELMKGATQIKLMAGGGVASSHDPLDVTQYTEDEMRAAVEAAAAWNTYVCVHAYTPAAIQQALHAGVKCIEHGQLIDEETMKMTVKSGAWLSMQPFLDDEEANPYPEGSSQRKKQLEMNSGTDKAYKLARQYGVKLAWGTDTLFDSTLAKRQGKQLAKMTRWLTPFETLKMATHDNAQLLALSGPRNPYPGELGVVKEGALADLLLVDGNPLENIQLIADPDKNFKVIIKDGKIFKNTL